jgi:23S rRNA (guanosine2251-2'-O)-methyltransferase
VNGQREETVFGVNAVLEGLRAGRSFRRILIQRGRRGSEIDEIEAAARERDIPVHHEPREALERLAGTPKHQGLVAFLTQGRYRPFEDLLANAAQRPGGPFLLVLDGVEDPRNLGAIARTAEAVGAHGLVVPQRRAAGVTAVAMKASAGALSHLPVAQVVNLARAMEQMKAAGCWLVGLDAKGESAYTAIDYRSPLAIVVGHEGEGLRASTLKACDFRVRVPMQGRVSSLNVSVAAAVVLYEALRQRSLELRKD